MIFCAGDRVAACDWVLLADMPECPAMTISERILMGPGPSNPYPEVVLAGARPMLGHLDPVFLSILDETNDRLRTLFETENRLTFPVSGTGSAGMETAFVNLVNPGDVVVVGVNGVFGSRMCEVAARKGAEIVRVDHEWGQPLDVDRVLDAHPAPAIIAAVHAETSTGVRSDIAALGAGKGDALLVMDCVTSLGGESVCVDEWNVDVAYSGSQKCLGAPPGLAPFTINRRARERIVEQPTSWYLDLNLISAYVDGEGGRAYHHTAPTSMIGALHAGLGAILDEGIDRTFERHRTCGDTLKDGFADLGFELFAQQGSRLSQLTTVWIPDGLDEAKIRTRLLEEVSIEVGGGLGKYTGRMWRVGTMGHTARIRNVKLLLSAVAEIVEAS